MAPASRVSTGTYPRSDTTKRSAGSKPRYGGNSGILTTASDLLFVGSTGDFYSGPTAERRENGYFLALDARTGKLLWERSLAGSVHSTPMTYSIAGTQYVAVTAGNNLFAFALRR